MENLKSILIGAFILIASDFFFAQTNSDTSAVLFIEMKTGNQYFGNVIQTKLDTIILNDFVLGKLIIIEKHTKNIFDLNSNSILYIKTTKGTEHIGKLLSVNEKGMQLETNNTDTLFVEYKNINEYVFNYTSKKKSVEENDNRFSSIELSEHAAQYYFIGPSALGLPQNKKQFKSVAVLHNEVDVPIGKYFYVGIGTYTFVLGISGVAKISVPVTKKLAVSLSGNGAFDTYKERVKGARYFGVGLFNFTIGNHTRNLTIGAGYYNVFGYYSDYPSYQLAVNYSIKPNNKLALMAEGYFISQANSFFNNNNLVYENGFKGIDYLAFAGVRYIGKKIIINPGIATYYSDLKYNHRFIFIPFLSLSAIIGRTYLR